jgi:hypothetical protein
LVNRKKAVLDNCGAFGGIWTRDHYLTKLSVNKKLPKAGFDSNFWLDFQTFTCNEYRHEYAMDIVRRAKQYSECLISSDLSAIKMLPTEKRRRVMQALSALAKYTGRYEQYKQMIKAYGLKWSVNNDDIIIARLIKYSGSNGNNQASDLFKWVNAVKQQIPEFTTFMDFTLSTGLRLGEAINSYRLIVELSESGRLGEYYNTERCVLEHFRFKALFIRRTKKAFMSFASNDLVERVAASGFKPTFDTIMRRMRRRSLKQCFSDLREVWASKSVRTLSQPEIDFLQGRISASVFMRNYFNPTWIADLKKRALKNCSTLLNYCNSV